MLTVEGFAEGDPDGSKGGIRTKLPLKRNIFNVKAFVKSTHFTQRFGPNDLRHGGRQIAPKKQLDDGTRFHTRCKTLDWTQGTSASINRLNGATREDHIVRKFLESPHRCREAMHIKEVVGRNRSHIPSERNVQASVPTSARSSVGWERHESPV